MTLDEILKTMKESNSFIILSHDNPDGSAPCDSRHWPVRRYSAHNRFSPAADRQNNNHIGQASGSS